MVLEHFAEQASQDEARQEEEEEEEEEEGKGGLRLPRFRLSETEWSRIVERFCGVSITEVKA